MVKSEKSDPKKYQRREFIKTTAKGIGGITLGGFFGNLIGRGYRTTKEEYLEHVDPYVKKGKEIIDKTEEVGDSIKEKGDDVKDWYNEKVNKYINKKAYKRQQDEKLEKEKRERAEREAEEKSKNEKMSRRGLFSKYLHTFNNNPIGIGTATGATIGGLVSTLKLFPKYIEKKKVAKLKDEHLDYKRRLEILEDYKKTLEEELTKRDGKITGLEDELGKIYEKLESIEKNKDNSRLERKIEEGNNLETSIGLLVSSSILMIALLIYEGARFSGFSISSNKIISIKPLSLITLFLSLLFALIGIIKLRKLRI